VLGWYRALCARFDINVANTGTGGKSWPLEVWFPEGRIRWDLLLTRVDYRDLHVVIDENPQLFAMFATSYPVDGDLETQMFAGFPDPVNAIECEADTSLHAIPVRAYRSLWTCLEPMSHGADGKSGNVTMFRRERSFDRLTGRMTLAPLYAGNAVRGALRDLGMKRALSLLDVDALDLPPALAHALFSGGSIESGSTGNVIDMTVERIAKELFPMWDLLAGCLDNRAMRGRSGVHDAVLVCRENAWRVHQHVAPKMPLAAFASTLQEAAALTQLRLGTRMAHKELADSTGAQMIFNTEVICAGAQWVHSIQIGAGITKMPPVTTACLADLLIEFQSIGVIGAQTSKMGHVDIGQYEAGEGVPALPSPAAYIEHMRSRKAEIIAWLMRGGASVTGGVSAKSAPIAASKNKKISAKDFLTQQKAAEEAAALHEDGTL
jgi:hypothetical protein